MVIATNLGFPRIGPKRELKKALEDYWAGKSSREELLDAARAIRKANWFLQKELGIQHIPSNDFSLYDHVLDTAVMVGAIPSRFGTCEPGVDLDTCFAMARGRGGESPEEGVPAMAMKKWFDTNYHYMVPEFESGRSFHLSSTKPVDEFLEAKDLGIHTRPVLLGPISFLLLGKVKDSTALHLLDSLLPVYQEILSRLADAGADWVQLDEPCLVLDLEPEVHEAYRTAYRRIAEKSSNLRLLLTTYFGDLRDNLSLALQLPVAGIHLDLVRSPRQVESALARVPDSMILSLGLINGRNVWRADLEKVISGAEHAVKVLGADRVFVGPSCSLLHSPVDTAYEDRFDEDLRGWLAFAKQKVQEICLVAHALNQGRGSVRDLLDENRKAVEGRRISTRVHNPAVKKRLSEITPDMLRRNSSFSTRKPLQQNRLNLPILPTTTIGSFPQTREVRAARAAFRAERIREDEYESFLQDEIEKAIRFQEEIGLDVLVHGEFERNDMVEYFGEQFSGFAATQNGWVQSYGSRCVKPPIIYGDLRRLQPMTVPWWRYAQSLTQKPVKGMLTGPVTVLQWSFVRDDQSREETCRQIALAIRNEVQDLEAAGCTIIQIDEPAIREGVPLRQADRPGYLAWAVDAFRLASSGVRDDTQIHTHMCYSEFSEIIEAIAALDADVLSIETSRSQLDLLRIFAEFHYPNEIGPGVYDIHSPRVPSDQEIELLLEEILNVLPARQVWVNPDCGLKTRRWEEVKPALANMVRAAKTIRARCIP